MIALLVAALALGAGVSAAQPRRDDGVGVIVYDDVNFQGPALTLRNDVPDLREFRLNDRISSLQMAPGETWEVCENINFGGRCAVLSGSERDLRPRGWNDMISSMRRVRGRDDRRARDDRDDRGRASITVYDDVNFRGSPFTFRGDVADLREFGLNDRISSLQMDPGRVVGDLRKHRLRRPLHRRVGLGPRPPDHRLERHDLVDAPGARPGQTAVTVTIATTAAANDESVTSARGRAAGLAQGNPARDHCALLGLDLRLFRERIAHPVGAVTMFAVTGDNRSADPSRRSPASLRRVLERKSSRRGAGSRAGRCRNA